jgi:hypothetical protein
MQKMHLDANLPGAQKTSEKIARGKFLARSRRPWLPDGYIFKPKNNNFHTKK